MSGNLLQARDPLGLQDVTIGDAQSISASPTADTRERTRGLQSSAGRLLVRVRTNMQIQEMGPTATSRTWERGIEIGVEGDAAARVKFYQITSVQGSTTTEDGRTGPFRSTVNTNTAGVVRFGDWHVDAFPYRGGNYEGSSAHVREPDRLRIFDAPGGESGRMQAAVFLTNHRALSVSYTHNFQTFVVVDGDVVGVVRWSSTTTYTRTTARPSGAQVQEAPEQVAGTLEVNTQVRLEGIDPARGYSNEFYQAAGSHLWGPPPEPPSQYDAPPPLAGSRDE